MTGNSVKTLFCKRMTLTLFAKDPIEFLDMNYTEFEHFGITHQHLA